VLSTTLQQTAADICNVLQLASSDSGTAPGHVRNVAQDKVHRWIGESSTEAGCGRAGGAGRHGRRRKMEQSKQEKGVSQRSQPHVAAANN
jgi:hypothetical protein